MAQNVFKKMEAAFKEKGVTIVLGMQIDLDLMGQQAESFVAIDETCLYLLDGSLKRYPFSELGELKVERMISTARLVAEKDGNSEIILLFSIGLAAQIEKLIKAIKIYKKPEKDKDDHVEDIRLDNDDLFCPKCGTRYPEPERKICPKCLDKMSITFRLMGYFKVYGLKIAFAMLGMLLLTFFSIISPLVGSRMFYDEVLTEGGKYFGMVGYFVALLFLIRFCGLLLNIFNSVILAKVVPWIIYDLKLKIFSAMQRLSVGFYTSKQTGNLMDRVNRDANNIYWFFVDGLPYVIINFFTFTSVLIVMCIQNLKLALITVVILPSSIFFFRVLFRFFRRMHHKFFVYQSQLSSLVSDSLNGQRVIKAFAGEDMVTDKFSGIGSKLTNTETQGMNLAFTAFPLIYLYMFLGQCIITAIGGIMVVNGELSIGTLLTFIAYLTMLYGPLEFMSWVSNWWSRCLDSAQRVFEIIDAKPDVCERENPIVLKEFKGDIEVKDVRFGYESSNPILKGLSLKVKSGEMLGLVGKTGAGKTTISNLIARLYDVDEGLVTIDGVNVKDLSMDQLRRNIGIVSQEMYLFIGSIADNIRYAKPEASIEEVIAAAKAASAHDFIMKLPDGYETRVGAGGQDLSGGERQRLSIARTIIQDPKILILDEATAAMDVETEMNIQKSFLDLKKGRTTIAIAHRLSTLRDADELAVVSDGKIVESGTHQELLDKKGEYHKLYTIQMEALKGSISDEV